MSAVVLLAGVGGSPGRDVTRQPVSVTAALDAAVASVDTARKELLDAVGLVVVAATALDAGTGQAGRRPPLGASLDQARTTLRAADGTRRTATDRQRVGLVRR